MRSRWGSLERQGLRYETLALAIEALSLAKAVDRAQANQ